MRAGRDTSAAWRVRATAVLAALLMALGASTPAIATEASEESPAMSHSLVDAGAKAEASEGSVDTASLDGFRPGNIISDEVFFAKDTMTESQIASFIQYEGRSCRSSSGLTCLKDYSQQTYSFGGDRYCSGYSGGRSETAAAMIFKSAQACGINPQVLLVTLQKEQSLVSAARSQTTYLRAMGYGCPDNVGGVCDPDYAGFHVQVYYAARQYLRYADPSLFTRYPVGKSSNIQFHPNASCGSSSVFIENQATRGLYIYTPYQPNAAALAANWGTGDGCSAYGNRNFYNYFTDWFGSTGEAPVNPVGAVESWTPIVGGVRLTGWSVDPNSDAAVSLRVKAGDVVAARVNAGLPSEAAEEQFPWHGPNHGFSVDVPLPAGAQEICVVANNIGAGSNKTLECRTVNPFGGDPFGEITSWTPYAGGVRVTGWAIDPDSSAAVTLRMKSFDTQLLRVQADRPDSTVASRYPAFGDAHGFTVEIPLAQGQQTVCVAMNNLGAGSNRTIGCTEVSPPGGTPFGELEQILAIPGGVRLQGWAIDPDTTGAIGLRIKSGSSVIARVDADETRSDIAERYVAFGGDHGFSLDVPLAAGTHQICVATNNIGDGATKTLGCASITPPTGTPFGYINSWTEVAGGIKIAGWAIDPDTVTAVGLRIKSGSEVVARANATAFRSDLENRYPAYGGSHAFYLEIALPPGRQDVCVVANNVGVGSNKTLGCRSITPLGGTPIGYINSWTPTDTGVKISGWAIDPDITGPATIRVKSGSDVVARFNADAYRSDLETRYPGYGGHHAFYADVPLRAGRNDVCVVVNNVGAGSTKTLGCRTIVR